MVKKDNIWFLCRFYCDNSKGYSDKQSSENVFKILEKSHIPLAHLIREEYDKRAGILFGQIYKSVLFSRFYIMFASLRLRIFIIRTSNKFKKEIALLTKFVSLCDDNLRVQTLYIGVTLSRCKKYMKGLFIRQKIDESIPQILKELEKIASNV
ncbi:conserved Plasmodium protein, unknown function [Plasmodium ovale]|uniref:Uncharacterized protein n=1 Tax=Plasmodium ovale TaxID=36330 RepID=A0A1D3U9T8_PLAOA|nr:conserved Plasmodium protein, unknown function [Plasmodium ovale]